MSTMVRESGRQGPVSVQFPRDVLRDLDERAASVGMARSTFIRSVILRELGLPQVPGWESARTRGVSR